MIGIDLGYWPIVILLGLIVLLILWAMFAEDYGDSKKEDRRKDELE